MAGRIFGGFAFNSVWPPIVLTHLCSIFAWCTCVRVRGRKRGANTIAAATTTTSKASKANTKQLAPNQDDDDRPTAAPSLFTHSITPYPNAPN
jgi:hypothetical protein